MEAIGNVSASWLKDATKVASLRENMRDAVEGKTSRVINKITSQSINNPADNVKVSDVPKGKINKMLYAHDDATVKGRVELENIEGLVSADALKDNVEGYKIAPENS